MSQSYKVDFATFCHTGDAHRLHAPGQLRRQVESNNYPVNKVYVIHQKCKPFDYSSYPFQDFLGGMLECYSIYEYDEILKTFGIDIHRQQYIGDQAHIWKNHVVNHLAAISKTDSDYIVFADNDCWMVRQPPGASWISRGIEILESDPDVFIVSPNDGEPERKTWRMSQQMFMAKVAVFRNADFNQPGWDGNVNIPGGPMPEYWAMLEGRMELYCRSVGMMRYVLGPEYRYWHHNKLTNDDLFETDMRKY